MELEIFPRCGHPRNGSRYCKPCRSEYDKKYRERTAAYQQARHEKYRKKHRKRASKAVRAWKLRNPEKVKELNAKFLADNPDYHREYQREHPQYNKAKCQRRRARVRQAEGTFTIADWESIVQRQAGRCAECRSLKPLTVDHIVPLSKGGSNWPSNLQGLCLSCNSSKGARM